MIEEKPSFRVGQNDISEEELIDTSTPQSLERDFYAWLKGDLSHQPTESQTCSMINSMSSQKSLIPQNFTTLTSATNNALPSIEQLSLGASLPPINRIHFKQEIDLLSDGFSPSSSLSSNASTPADTPLFASLAYSFFNIGTFGVGSNVGILTSCPEPIFGYDAIDCGINSTKTIKKESQTSVIKKPRRNASGMSSSGSNSNPPHGGRNSGTNQLGRTYNPGLPLSMQERQRIVSLYRAGWKICDISKQLCVTHSCVSKILHRFKQTGSVKPKDAKEGRLESPLVKAIRDYRNRLGICRQSEIREQLIRDGLCRKENAPSRSSINHILRTKLDVRLKK